MSRQSPNKQAAAIGLRLAQLRLHLENFELERRARLRSLLQTGEAHVASFSRARKALVASLPPSVGELPLRVYAERYAYDTAAAEEGLLEEKLQGELAKKNLALEDAAAAAAAATRKGKRKGGGTNSTIDSVTAVQNATSKKPRPSPNPSEDGWDMLSAPSPSSPVHTARRAALHRTGGVPSSASRSRTTRGAATKPSGPTSLSPAAQRSGPPSIALSAATFTYDLPSDAPSYEALLAQQRELLHKQQEAKRAMEAEQAREKAAMAEQMRKCLDAAAMSDSARRRLEEQLSLLTVGS